MAKRTLLAFGLVMVLIVVAQYFTSRNAPRQQPPAQAQSQAPAPTSPAQPAPSPPAATTPAATTAKSNAPSVTPTRAAQSESETVVESDQFRVVFTNRGAQVKSWV